MLELPESSVLVPLPLVVLPELDSPLLVDSAPLLPEPDSPEPEPSLVEAHQLSDLQ